MLIRKLYLSLFLLTTLLISGCGVSKQDSIYYDYIKSAGKKYKKGDYTASIEISRKAAEFDPKKFNAFACIADVFFMLEKYDSAIKEYDTAILINPSCGGCMFFKAEALGKLKRYDEATAAYSETIKKNYLKACCYNNRGNIKDHHKLYDAALKDYDSSISTSFYNHRFIYINKSDVYCGKEKYDSALLELDKCIKTDPKQLSFAAHIKNLNEQNLLKQSEALLKDTCFSKQMKCFVDAYTRKGYLDILLGKYKEASLYLNYERLLPIPSYTQLIYRSYIPFNTMQFDVSNQYLDSAIALDPKSGYGYMQKGNIRKLLGKYDEALGYYNKTIEVDTTTNSRYDNRGELYILMDSLDAAIADFNTAIKIDDNKPDPWEYNARGYAYFLKKQYKEALVDYDSAIKTAKNYYQPLYNYKEEATKAMQTGNDVFCTLIMWQAPVNNVNGLVDHAKFHITNGETLTANFKITTNKPFAKDKLFVMVDGQSVAMENNATLTIIKEDATTKKYEYSYGFNLAPNKGQHLLHLEYEGKSSQKMQVVVE